MIKKLLFCVTFLTYGFTNLLWLAIGLWPYKFFSINNIEVDRKSHSLSFKANSFAYLHQSTVEKFYKDDNTSFSIELVIVPNRFTSHYVPRIISIGDKRKEIFMIGQWERNLIIRNSQDKSKNIEFGKENVLIENKPLYISVMHTPDNISLYIDGQPFKSVTNDFRWKKQINRDYRITIGNSVFGDQQWYGTLLALSIYNRPLLADECRDHFALWTENNRLANIAKGNVFVYPSSDSKQLQQMVIPKTFSPQQKKYLTPPWDEFKLESDYASDLILNFFAFVILGFLTVASYSFFSLKKTLLLFIAALNSFLISITIETLQVFLPSRTSQLSDLILNTLGGYSGGVVYYYVVSFIKRLPSHIAKIKINNT